MSSTANENTYIEVTPDRHGAFVIIASLVGLIWTLLIIGIRVYLRLRLTPPFGWDDLAAIFGTIVGLVQTSVTIDAVNHGIGTRESLLTSHEAAVALKRLYVSWLLYPIAVCSSKVSIALLIARLTRTEYHLWASYALTALSLLWGIISIFLIAFQCSTPQPWNIGATTQCSTMFAQWTVVEAVNMAIELLIPCLIIVMVWSLHMPIGTKVTVVLAFSLQLLVVFPTIIRILFLQQATAPQTSRTYNDNTFTLTNSTLITEVVMHFSLIAATFPCLRKFLQAFDMHMGATTNLTSEGDTGSSSFAMKSLEASHGGGSNVEIYRAMPRSSGMGNVTVVSTVDHSSVSQGSRSEITPGERGSEESDWSQRVMIRETQRWEVVSSTK